jgi:hypothetical protein
MRARVADGGPAVAQARTARELPPIGRAQGPAAVGNRNHRWQTRLGSAV